MLRSTEAAVVVRVDPAMITMSVPGPGESPGIGCGPYELGAWQGVIERVVHPGARGPVLEVGRTVRIWPADTGAMLALAAEHCRTSGTRSPIFRHFDGAEPKGSVLALLRWSPPFGWTEAVSGSWLPIERAGSLPVPQAALSGDRPSAEPVFCRADDECTLTTLDCGPCGVCPGYPGMPHHVDTVAAFSRACAASREAQNRIPVEVRGPAPNCSPCQQPPPPPAIPPRAACEATRCVQRTK